MDQQCHVVTNIFSREMIPALEFWTGEGLAEFFQNGRTGNEVKAFGSPRMEELRRSATGCDERADEDIRVEDGLRHSIAHDFDGMLVLSSPQLRHHDVRHVLA
jgi:hypothetical protein